MRTEDQIKRKRNELLLQQRALEARRSPDLTKQNVMLQMQSERLSDMIMLLDWVLNEPSGSYHG